MRKINSINIKNRCQIYTDYAWGHGFNVMINRRRAFIAWKNINDDEYSFFPIDIKRWELFKSQHDDMNAGVNKMLNEKNVTFSIPEAFQTPSESFEFDFGKVAESMNPVFFHRG